VPLTCPSPQAGRGNAAETRCGSLGKPSPSGAASLLAPPAGRAGVRGGADEDRRPLLLLLVAPALAMVLALYVYPLCYSLLSALPSATARLPRNFVRPLSSTPATSPSRSSSSPLDRADRPPRGRRSAAISCRRPPRAVAILKWLYRWPLFVPFIRRGAMMRNVSRQERLLNQTRSDNAGARRCRRDVGAPRLARHHRHLCVEGDAVCRAARRRRDGRARRAMIEAARTSAPGACASSPRFWLPQIAGVMTVGLVLAFVTMLSVLSVPMMLSGGSRR